MKKAYFKAIFSVLSVAALLMGFVPVFSFSDGQTIVIDSLNGSAVSTACISGGNVALAGSGHLAGVENPGQHFTVQLNWGDGTPATEGIAINATSQNQNNFSYTFSATHNFSNTSPVVITASLVASGSASAEEHDHENEMHAQDHDAEPADLSQSSHDGHDGQNLEQNHDGDNHDNAGDENNIPNGIVAQTSVNICFTAAGAGSGGGNDNGGTTTTGGGNNGGGTTGTGGTGTGGTGGTGTTGGNGGSGGGILFAADLSIASEFVPTSTATNTSVRLKTEIKDNSSTTATNILVKFNLPTGLVLKNTTPSAGTFDQASSTWNALSLLPGNTSSIEMELGVPDSVSGTLISTADASAESPDQDLSNNHAVAQLNVVAGASTGGGITGDRGGAPNENAPQTPVISLPDLLAFIKKHPVPAPAATIAYNTDLPRSGTGSVLGAFTQAPQPEVQQETPAQTNEQAASSACTAIKYSEWYILAAYLVLIAALFWAARKKAKFWYSGSAILYASGVIVWKYWTCAPLNWLIPAGMLIGYLVLESFI